MAVLDFKSRSGRVHDDVELQPRPMRFVREMMSLGDWPACCFGKSTLYFTSYRIHAFFILPNLLCTLKWILVSKYCFACYVVLIHFWITLWVHIFCLPPYPICGWTILMGHIPDVWEYPD